MRKESCSARILEHNIVVFHVRTRLGSWVSNVHVTSAFRLYSSKLMFWAKMDFC